MAVIWAKKFPNARAWRSRLGTPVSDIWAESVRIFFKTLIYGPLSGSNLFAKLEVLVIPAHAANNWINIVKDKFNPTLGGGNPTFAAATGWTFDGIDDWMDTNFNPTQNRNIIGQNDVHYRLKCSAKIANNNPPFGWFDGIDGVSLNPNDVSNRYSFRANQANLTIGTPVAVATSDMLVNRNAINAVQLYIDGVAQAITSGATETRTTFNDATYNLGRITSSLYGPASITDYSIGTGSFTINEILDLTNALATLRSAAGHP